MFWGQLYDSLIFCFIFFGYCLNSEQNEFLFVDDEDKKQMKTKKNSSQFLWCASGVNVLFVPYVAFIYTLQFIEVFHLADKNNCSLRFLSVAQISLYLFLNVSSLKQINPNYCYLCAGFSLLSCTWQCEIVSSLVGGAQDSRFYRHLIHSHDYVDYLWNDCTLKWLFLQ